MNQSTVNSRCQGVRYVSPCRIFTSGHIESFPSLPTNLRHENAFLCLEYDEKSCINELKYPERYKCKISFTLKLGVVMFQRPFCAYLDISCICVLTQVKKVNRGLESLPLNRFNHMSGVTAVNPADRPKSERNRCVIEVLVAFLCCHDAFWIFKVCRQSRKTFLLLCCLFFLVYFFSFISFPLSAFCDFSAIFHRISLIFGQLVDNNL